MKEIRKKVREAARFLGELQERDREAFGNHEDFDHALSAYLSAARSVDYRLRHIYGDPYRTYFENTWKPALTPAQRCLLEFMITDRNHEVHHAGSSRRRGEERIPVRNRYENGSGSMTVFGPLGAPPVQIVKPAYTFKIDGHQLPVVKSCREFQQLIERLVEDFSRHIGSTQPPRAP